MQKGQQTAKVSMLKERHHSKAQGKGHNLICCPSRAQHQLAKDMQGEKKKILLVFTNFMQFSCFYCSQILEAHKELDNKKERWISHLSPPPSCGKSSDV